LEDANCESGKNWNEEVSLNTGKCMAAVGQTTRISISIGFVAAEVSVEHGPNPRIERNL
jgi:hypothetical protein